MFDVGDHCPVIHCQQPLIVMQPDWLFVTQLLPFEPFWTELKQNYHWLYISSKLSKLYHCNTGITRFTRASVSENRREVILKWKVIWNIALNLNFKGKKNQASLSKNWMEKRVREWLAASGSLPTIQARLRADLYAAIQVNIFLEQVFNLNYVAGASGTGIRSHSAPQAKRRESQCWCSNQVRLAWLGFYFSVTNSVWFEGAWIG